MNFRNTLILSLCFLFGGAAASAAQDTIPAPPEDGQSPQLALEQWVQPNADGLLIGQIMSVDDEPVGRCDVALVDTENVVKQFSSDEQGKVTLRGVRPGLYAVAVRGENLIATYALHVIGREGENVSRDAAFTIVAARVDSRKFYSQIVRYIPVEGAPGYSFEPAEGKAIAETIGRPGLARVQQVDGGLEGCLYTAGVENGRLVHAPQTYVFVLRDGVEVARAVTDSQGCYRFEEMEPGRYSFIAVGQSGVAATGFELVDVELATADARQQDASFQLTSAVQPPGVPAPGQLNIQMAPPQAALSGFEAMGGPGDGLGPPPGGPLPPPGAGGGVAGGGFGGGGAGGGGAGGGGGGVGGLLGIAGLAAAVVALADDDDDFDVPEPASPPVPAIPAGIPPGPPAGIPPGPPAR